MMPVCMILITSAGTIRNADLAEGYISGRGIVPVLIKGNSLTCTDMICASPTFLTITREGDELPTSDYAGTYPLGNCGTLTIMARGDKTIAWRSDVDINCIFMKGGWGGNSYWYDPPSRSDSGLSTPLDTLNGKPSGIGHITICYTLPDSAS